MHRYRFVASLVIALSGCAHETETKSVEAHQTEMLSYTAQMDTTRLVRGTGLQPVPAVDALVEEDLAPYFKVHKGTGNDERREIIAESPAPGYGVRVVIESRPDAFCFLAIDIVRFNKTAVELVPLAPYSVHVGVDALRNALASLRGANRPALSDKRFDALRTQAAALARKNADPPMDNATFKRTPRPLEHSDDAPLYYAPSEAPTQLRGDR